MAPRRFSFLSQRDAAYATNIDNADNAAYTDNAAGATAKLPPWCSILCALQLFFTFLVLGLTGYGLSAGEGHAIRPALILVLTSAILTIIPLVPLIFSVSALTPKPRHGGALVHPLVALASSFVGLCLWLASLTALACYVRIYKWYRFEDELFLNGWHVSAAWKCGVAGCVFAGVEGLLFLATTLAVYFSLHHHRHHHNLARNNSSNNNNNNYNLTDLPNTNTNANTIPHPNTSPFFHPSPLTPYTPNQPAIQSPIEHIPLPSRNSSLHPAPPTPPTQREQHEHGTPTPPSASLPSPSPQSQPLSPVSPLTVVGSDGLPLSVPGALRAGYSGGGQKPHLDAAGHPDAEAERSSYAGQGLGLPYPVAEPGLGAARAPRPGPRDVLRDELGQEVRQ